MEKENRTLRVIAYILGGVAIMSAIYSAVLIVKLDKALEQATAASEVYSRHLLGEEHTCGSPPGNPRSELLDQKWIKCVDDARAKAEEKVAAEIVAYRQYHQLGK